MSKIKLTKDDAVRAIKERITRLMGALTANSWVRHELEGLSQLLSNGRDPAVCSFQSVNARLLVAEYERVIASCAHEDTLEAQKKSAFVLYYRNPQEVFCLKKLYTLSLVGKRVVYSEEEAKKEILGREGWYYVEVDSAGLCSKQLSGCYIGSVVLSEHGMLKTLTREDLVGGF